MVVSCYIQCHTRHPTATTSHSSATTAAPAGSTAVTGTLRVHAMRRTTVAGRRMPKILRADTVLGVSRSVTPAVPYSGWMALTCTSAADGWRSGARAHCFALHGEAPAACGTHRMPATVACNPPPPYPSASALGCALPSPHRDPTGYHSWSPWSQPGVQL